SGQCYRLSFSYLQIHVNEHRLLFHVSECNVLKLNVCLERWTQRRPLAVPVFLTVSIQIEFPKAVLVNFHLLDRDRDAVYRGDNAKTYRCINTKYNQRTLRILLCAQRIDDQARNTRCSNEFRYPWGSRMRGMVQGKASPVLVAQPSEGFPEDGLSLERFDIRKTLGNDEGPSEQI